MNKINLIPFEFELSDNDIMRIGTRVGENKLKRVDNFGSLDKDKVITICRLDKINGWVAIEFIQTSTPLTFYITYKMQ